MSGSSTTSSGHPSAAPGHLLREARGWKRLSQREVADRLGVTQAAVSMMESAGDEIQVATMRRYLQALGFDLRLEIRV